jgi:hypothetical protein
MFRTALIALALCLFLAGTSSARAGEGGNNNPDTQILFFRPVTFICDPPGPEAKTAPKASNPGAQPRPIPPGKQLKDLCPPGAMAYFIYDHAPPVSQLPFPLFLDSPAPRQPRPDPGRKSHDPDADTGTTPRHP